MYLGALPYNVLLPEAPEHIELKGRGDEAKRKKNRQKKDGGAAAVVEEKAEEVGVAQKTNKYINA